VRSRRLPLALHLDKPDWVGVGATLRGRPQADEHPLARLARSSGHESERRSEVPRGVRDVLHRRGQCGVLLGRATTASSASAAAKGRVYTGRVGDVLRVPAAATRCTVNREAAATNLICAHTPRARYSVVFFKDNLFVYRNDNPDNPVFSARGRP
jgi:hypothetical protein